MEPAEASSCGEITGAEVAAAMTSTIDPVLEAVAWPGQKPRGPVLPGVVAAGVALLAGPRVALWQLATYLALPVGAAAKRLIGRPRPFPGRLNPRAGMPQDPSFPSTHVSEYVTTFGFASWLLWRRRSPARVPVAIRSLAAVGLIGPSRVRTGDHRWSDVAGGYLLGAAAFTALIALASRDKTLLRHPRSPDRPVVEGAPPTRELPAKRDARP
jgi:membrane-associated phospholipid phosphatase